MDILKNLFGALDIVAIERVSPSHFRVIGSLPGWFVRLYPEVVMESDQLKFSGRFPFLENFLIDAEKFWSSADAGRLKSGVWIEADAFGTERQLEATALSLAEIKILLIEFPRMEFEEKQQLIQKGREQKLGARSQSKIKKTLQKTEKRYYTLLQAIPDQLFFFSFEGICIDPIDDPTRARPGRFTGMHIDEVLGAGVAQHILALATTAMDRGSVETFRWEKQESGKSKIYQAYIAAPDKKEFIVLIK